MKITKRTIPGNPGNNLWSSISVLQTQDNELMLYQGKYCAEAIVEEPLGYGKYIFTIHKPWLMNKNIVLGLFLYYDDKNEIDIEFSRWGKWWKPNLWFTNQHPHKTYWHWDWSRKLDITIDWHKTYVELTVNNITHRFDKRLPPESKLIFNLWKYKPTNSKHRVVIKDFKYKSL